MADVFYNERVQVSEWALVKYPDLKGCFGEVVDERRLPPFGRQIVARWQIGSKQEFKYMLPDEVTSAEGAKAQPTVIRAISLWQPWATLVALGEKRYETRHWNTGYRGLLAIHAAKRWTQEERDAWAAFQFSNNRIRHMHDPLPLGAVLCVARLRNVRPVEGVRPFISEKEKLYGNYNNGRYAWELEVVEVFENPIPAKGAQGFWNWTRPAAA